MKILSKLKYWHDVFLYFIWRNSIKKKMTIDGYSIEYMKVSRYLLWTAWLTGEAFCDACCITYEPSKTVMIFLSHKQCASPEFRYILFHEFIEGGYLLGDKVFVKQNKQKLRRLMRLYFKGYFSKKVIDAFNRSEANTEHMIALIFEFDLAKREMSDHQFNNYLDDVVKNRLQLQSQH